MAEPVVPCRVVVNNEIWQEYTERLEALEQECPHIPIGGRVRKRPERTLEHTDRDDWGCLWHRPGLGLEGQVVEHPLSDWDAFDSWQPPSPEDCLDAARNGVVHLEHGFLFLRLTYLRGFENFMIDVAEEHPKLYALRDLVADYWYEVARIGLDRGARAISAGDDLGQQDRLLISPPAWRHLIKPSYARIFGLARDRGATVRLHSDGFILDIIPDLIETGVTDLNPQDLVNGIDNLERVAKGKVHISLELDEQSVTAFGSDQDVDAHIEKCVRTLGSPEGGLSIDWTAYPGTPVDSIEAVVRAMERHRGIWE